MNDREGTEEKKNIPSLPFPAARIAGLVQLSQSRLDAPMT